MCTWLDLDRAPLGLIIVALAALAASPWLEVPSAPAGDPPPRLTGRGALRSLSLAALIVAPTGWLLVNTLHDEFPFNGDHFHHLTMGRLAREFWSEQLVWVALFAAAVWLIRRLGIRPWAALAFAGLFAWSFAAEAPPFAARYPATQYLLDLPLQGITTARHWPNELDAHRITNAVSVIGWLFVLRPLIVRRWPELAIVPFALFYYWQCDSVYYTASPYLEPWAIALVLVALELLYSDLPSRSWLPVLLVGAAAGIKEQAIVIVPWVALATLAMIPRTRRAWAAATLNGLLAILPFAIYLKTLRSEVARTFQFAPWDRIASSDRVEEFGARLIYQFGVLGIALLIGSLATAGYLAWRTPKRRWLTLCLAGAAATQLAFFYLDKASVPFTGYSRFHLFTLVLLGAAAWLPDRALRESPRARPIAIAAAIAIGVAQLPPLAHTLALATKPAPARNHFEWEDCPLYFPLRSLIRQGQADLTSDQPIVLRSLSPELFGDPATFDRALAKWKFIYAPVADCTCRRETWALLVRVPFAANNRQADADRPLAPDLERCLAEMRASYRHFYDRSIDGRPTAAFGVGCTNP